MESLEVAATITSPNPARLARFSWASPAVRLPLITLLAVAVHGYHFGVDDAAIYLPAVLKVVHPSLYPYGAEFFETHAAYSQFAWVVGHSARLTHLDPALVIFFWYVLTLLLFLIAAWRLAKLFFLSDRARWSAVLMSAAVLTLPVAGTALAIQDPYLTARSASTPFTMLAIAAWLAGRRSAAILWILLAFVVHPLMAAYGLLCLGALAVPPRRIDRLFRRFPSRASLSAAAITPAYRQALEMRNFLYLLRWRWWEWIGLVAPVVILLWLGSIDLRGTTPLFRRASRSLALLGIAATISAAVITSVPRLEGFVRLQPMRVLQLVYILFFLLLGGLLGEYLPQRSSWPKSMALPGLLTALFVTMFSVQCRAYPASRHIEWPWSRPVNQWGAAFEWARDNTPENAVFALDPGYINLPGEDQHGFRAIAQRSVLSDYFKDSGAVSVFPHLAAEWQQQQQAQAAWRSFQLADFERLAMQYPVTWVVLRGRAPGGLDCRYHNEAVSICRIPGATGLPAR